MTTFYELWAALEQHRLSHVIIIRLTYDIIRLSKHYYRCYYRLIIAPDIRSRRNAVFLSTVVLVHYDLT